MIRKVAYFTSALAAVALLGQQTSASGIPTASPLFYSGSLLDNGAPVDDVRTVQIFLWDSETATGTSACTTNAPSTPIVKGRFRVALSDTCVAAIHANPDLFVEVSIGGVSLGRRKLGAVPYAVEAGTASAAAGTLATQVVPAGAVMFFDAAACPTGWAELTEARGRYIVGLPLGGTLKAAVGSQLTDQENRASGQHHHVVPLAPHFHSVNDPGHQHGIYQQAGANNYYFQSATFGAASAPQGATAAVVTGLTVRGPTSDPASPSMTSQSDDGTGLKAGTNAPYLQLRACKKL